MNRMTSFLSSLRRPLRQIQVLMAVGAAFVLYAVLSATGGPPKPWEDEGPEYIVGEVEGFTRTFPSRPIPDIEVIRNGSEVSLRNVAQGKPIVLNLWATWCAPCLEELPSLSVLQERLGDSVEVYAVALESGDGSRQEALLERLGAENLELLLDPRLALGRAYSEDLRLPITVIYDGRGREIGRLEGAADWSSPEAIRLVRAIASGAVPG